VHSSKIVAMHRRLIAASIVVVALFAAAPAGAQDPPPEPVIADGVTVAGVDLSGLTAWQAKVELRAFFDRRLRFRLGGQAYAPPPRTFAWPRLPSAVSAALAAAPATALRLGVGVRERALTRWVNRRAKAFRRAPVSTRVVLEGLRPRLTRPREGRRLLRKHTRYRLERALRTHERNLGAIRIRTIRAKVRPSNFGKVIVIKRDSRRLKLFRPAGTGKMRRVATFPVAVGMPAWPTPTGNLRIASMQRNPWWYPPNQPWAEGASPVPPGPGNPLGTRWMGTNLGGIGIHGTYNPGSIGTAASHGCIRMYIRDSEWLYERIRIGTPVFIRAA
jgi:lipoprotein-anchoring transpeptidase ErfK/SrfK